MQRGGTGTWGRTSKPDN